MKLLRQAKSIIREWKKARKRSPEWRKIRNEFLQANPECVACGSRTLLQIHHCSPFHLYPELELDPKNLITLCMGTNECHLLIGHGDDFKCFNPTVLSDALSAREEPEMRELIIKRAHANRKID